MRLCRAPRWPSLSATCCRAEAGQMAEELVTMSRKEIDRLEVIRRVLERRLSQVKAALSVLDLRQTSIDGEIYTGDERTLIGGEEYDGSCDFLELASPTEGNLRGPLRSRRVRRCDHVSLSRRHRAGPDLPSATRRPRPS